MQFAPQKLGLGDAEPIGMGNRRRVFEHPNNPNLCIKIARSEHIRAQMDERGFFYRLMPTRWRDDNWLEARAYQQEVLETADPAIWLHLTRISGPGWCLTITAMPRAARHRRCAKLFTHKAYALIFARRWTICTAIFAPQIFGCGTRMLKIRLWAWTGG